MTRKRKDNIWERWFSRQTFDPKESEVKVQSYFNRNIPRDSDPIQFILLSCDRQRQR